MLQSTRHVASISATVKYGLLKGKQRIQVQIQSRFSHSALSNDNDDHAILSLPPQYLRAMDSSEFDPSTFQRCKVRYNPNNGKPIIGKRSTTSAKIAQCSFDAASDCYHIVWEDGVQSVYDNDWVQAELSKLNGDYCQDQPKKLLWANLSEEKVRHSSISLAFQNVVHSNQGMGAALNALYQYGMLLVTQTPTDDNGAGVAALAAALGGASRKEGNSTSLVPYYRDNPQASPLVLSHGTDGPLRTLYGTVWSTETSAQVNGASVADSAYGMGGLPLHTDMTYWQDPPGLQIFTMVQPALKGGESVFADGFAIAERLRRHSPEAFAMLSQVSRRYRCIDPTTGWHLEAHGPVISLRNGQLVGIRHNDLDRLPDLPPRDCQDVETFYNSLADAHYEWDKLLSMEEFRLVMALKPGDTMVVANHVSRTLSSWKECAKRPLLLFVLMYCDCLRLAI
jgi:alpha-ketoglutarate-dependent taurine dioxygenase